MNTKNNKKWILLINPQSGKGKGLKNKAKIIELLTKEGFRFTTFITERKHHATEITIEQIKNGNRSFIIIGGDGTINEVVNGIMQQTVCKASDIIIASIPVGTGNDWGRLFQIPKNLSKAIELIKSGSLIKQDVGMVTYTQNQKQQKRYFVNIAGVGYDALVAKKTNRLNEQKIKVGKLLYFYSLFACLIRYKTKQAAIYIDDKLVDCKLFSMSVGIGAYKGGGLKLVPNAVPNDGFFDITLIKDVKKTDMIKYLPKLFTGAFTKHPKIETYRCKSVGFESINSFLLEADGEIMGYPPYCFQIIHEAIGIIGKSGA